MNDSNPQATIEDVCIIHIRRIKAASLFKLLFIGTITIAGPFCLFCGILALFGANTVTFNNSYITDAWGLITALIMAPVFSAIAAAFIWIGCYLGIRIWGKFNPIKIEYVPAEG